MSTVEEFRNAPVGATATNSSGSRAMKMDGMERHWIHISGTYLNDVDMGDFTLDAPAPNKAREALELAWELAHEVKPGQVIPKGTELLEFSITGLKEYTAYRDFGADLELASIVRTLEPLPDPEPDWLDAPAVLAAMSEWPTQVVWVPKIGGYWECTCHRGECHWSDLRDVTPLYPKEEQNS